MTTPGVVRQFSADEGIGVIDSDQTPGGAFVHFSVIQGPGFASLAPGDEVRFDFEQAAQDGYSFRATAVERTGGAERTGTASSTNPPSSGSAYGSSFTIRPAAE